MLYKGLSKHALYKKYFTKEGGRLKISGQIDQNHEKDLKRIKGFRLIDDDFMTVCFEDEPGCIAIVLQILLDQPLLEIQNVRTQVFVGNLLKRSVQSDVDDSPIGKLMHDFFLNQSR